MNKKEKREALMRIYIMAKKTILSVALAVLCLIGGVFLLHMGVESTTKDAMTEAIFQGTTNEKAVALAINVDWGEDVLPAMLELLEQEEVKVTFFVSGRFAEKNPELVCQIAELGHEIGNHGYSHPHPDRLSITENEKEIKKTEEILRQLGVETVALFAPPYGEFGATCLEAAANCHYQTIMWTRDTIDWQEPAPDKNTLVERLVGEPLASGMLFLMHPKQHTVEALPEIIAEITAQGFCCRKVSEVL